MNMNSVWSLLSSLLGCWAPTIIPDIDSEKSFLQSILLYSLKFSVGFHINEGIEGQRLKSNVEL